MEACWPSGVALRGEASNHPVLRWLKTVVVSDREEARSIASGADQEDVPEAPGPGSRSSAGLKSTGLWDRAPATKTGERQPRKPTLPGVLQADVIAASVP